MDLEQRKAKAAELKGREVRRAPFGDLEVRELPNGNVEFSGYASATEREYDMGWYAETIARTAFDETLTQRPDVQLLVNHEGLPLARTVSGTLRLSADDNGLHPVAELNPNDPDVARLLPKVERGDLTEMSFAFSGARSECDEGLPLARTVSGTLRLSADDNGLHPVAELNPNDPDVARLLPKVERGDLTEMSFAFSGARSEWDEEMTHRRIVSLSLHRGDVSIVSYGANPHTSFSMRDALTMLASADLAEARDGLATVDLISLYERLGQLLFPKAPEEALDATLEEKGGLPLDLARALNLAGR